MTIAARPTMYRGTPMRSRLEAKVAAFLDREKFTWRYEPMAYASRAGQYLPDFEVLDVPSPLGWTGEGGWGLQPLFLEVKGATPEIDEQRRLGKRMQIILESLPGAQLAVIPAEGLQVAGGVYFPLWWSRLPSSARPGRWGSGGIGRCRCGMASFFPYAVPLSRERAPEAPWFACRRCGSDTLEDLVDLREEIAA